MKVDIVKATSNADTLREIKKVNSDSVVREEAKYEKVQEYEASIIKDSITDISLLNKNVQTEVSKLQVAKKYLIEEHSVFSSTKEKLKSTPNVEIANKEILDCVNKIDEISSNATFENVKLFESGREYQEGKFRVPSINVGGKSYLHIQNMDISTVEGLNNALATIDKAIDKITSEISLCDGSIDFLCDKVNVSKNSFDGSISDINVAKERMNSLKQKIYREAYVCMKTQSTEFIDRVVNLLD